MTEYDDLKDRLEEIEDAIGPDDTLTVEMVWGEEEPDGDPDFLIRSSVVMYREDAEREGREILGPAETGTDADAVRVRPEGVAGGDRGGAGDSG